jgi:Uma2 family endonuclease
MSMTITTFDETAFDIPSGVDTLNGFRRWAYSRRFPQRGRISFLDGELEIDMSPEEIDSHSTLKDALLVAMSNFVEDRQLGRVFGDGVMLVNVLANIANEPDVTFCAWQTLISKRAELRETKPGSRRFMELRGSPDVVVEVLSRSSDRKDKKILRQKYFEGGVREYWLIDARGRTIEFDLLTRGTGRFRTVRPGKDGSRLSAVFQRRIRVTRELDRIGRWKYRIEYLPPQS